MRKRSFFWNVFPSFIAITLLSCICLFIFAKDEFKKFYLEHTVNELKTRAVLFKEVIGETEVTENARIDSIAVFLGNETKTRYTVILHDGKVVADSKEEPDSMDNHKDRPEIKEALKGNPGVSTRYSRTLGRKLMYVAIPVVNDNTTVFVIRTSLPLVTLMESINVFSSRLTPIVIAILCISILFSLIISRRLSRPLGLLKRIANRIAEGDLSQDNSVYNNIETAELAYSMNMMAKQLDERIKKISIQKNEQNAILSSMVEGVIALDIYEHIMMINNAAAKILEIEPEKAKGKWIQEAVRNTEILKFINQLHENDKSFNDEIAIVSSPYSETIIKIQGTTLKDADGLVKGSVLVMHDITDFKRLENIRREFVANVSHELRTPLTTIKGFIETLQDGAQDKPEDRERFFYIINNHVNRLNALIEDLLTISRLEREEEAEDIKLETVSFNEIIDNVLEVCSPKADDKNIAVNIDIESDIIIHCDPQLIEQACINLLDNAIKYSGNDGSITVTCGKNDNNIEIHVIDSGLGIAKIHLPRLFERFYRVDKARSRKGGGTGLGLAIVKHIANLHKGTVSVKSKVGIGSEFIITLLDK